MPVAPPKHRLRGSSPYSRTTLVSRPFPGRRGPGDHWWRGRLLRLGALVVLVGTIVLVGAVAWVSQDLPDPNNLNSRVVAQSTKIYARDGKTILYDIHGDQRRTVIELKDINPFVVQATLSVEDKDFYKHGGVSIRGILRSIFVDITHGSKAQGGSTITQQLVKNSILTSEKSYTRKLKELILAYQIEKRFTKDQILKMYFNQIPYGSSAYGVEAAAQTYFGIHAKDLDLAQSALLAALVQAPTHYSPSGNHRDELLQRQQYVLGLMVENKYITKAQADAAKAEDVLAKVVPYRDRVIAPHFVFYVRDALVQKYGELMVEQGGLRVVTTLDAKLQTIAEEEVKKGADRNEKYNASNAALVAIDPKTGQVLAMVGSRDYFDQQHDGNFNVATAVRNPGSSFKPVVYLTAFTEGYTPDTVLFDLKTNFGPDGSGKDFVPNNYDLKEHGPLKMRQTLAGSLNIAAVKTLYLAGIDNVINLADSLGYTTIDRTKVGLALAIGGGGVRLIEHVSAFSVFANDGVRNPPVSVLRVEDKNGRVLEQYEKKEKRVVDQDNVRQLVSILSDNNARAFVFGPRSPLILTNRPVAAKTGTTNDFKDGWTVGFTPSLAAGVWVGRNDNGSLRSGSDGVVVAAPIWHAFMERALQGKPVDNFPKPPPNAATKPILQGKLQSETPMNVDTVTGGQIPDACLAAWPKNTIKQVFVKEVHDILYYVDRSNPTGPAPTNPSSDPMFSRWEGPVQAWAKKNGYVAKAPPIASCNQTGIASGTVTISQPAAESTVSGPAMSVTVDTSNIPNVASVQYALDGAVVTTVSDAPFSTTIDVSKIGNGFHTLRAIATNSSGQSTDAEVTVNILSDASKATLYFVSPTPKSVVSRDAFPRTVRVYAYAPSGILNITLSIKNPDGTAAVVDSIDNPDASTVSLSWSTTPPGAYQLFFTVKDKKGVTAQSDLLPVSVS